MTIPVNIEGHPYDIVVERGAIRRAATYIPVEGKVLVVTDSGVPAQWPQAVCSAYPGSVLVTIPQGEASKNMDSLRTVLSALVDNGFTRTDCVIAVGGGVVGDLSGLAAALYMRGIRFYNIPTTLLSQVDSSIGGKTAIDFQGVKNVVGAFHQPSGVLIDPDVLDTLDDRLLHEGLAESIKMAATSNAELFSFIESSTDIRADIEKVIVESLLIKKAVVEADPTEKGLRRVLNFGHTLGHAIESASAGSLYHGECVAAGMMGMCSAAAGDRLRPLLRRYGLPVGTDLDRETLLGYVRLDKKASGRRITTVWVEEIGSFEFREMQL